jgi:hypothetical protein
MALNFIQELGFSMYQSTSLLHPKNVQVIDTNSYFTSTGGSEMSPSALTFHLNRRSFVSEYNSVGNRGSINVTFAHNTAFFPLSF